MEADDEVFVKNIMALRQLLHATSSRLPKSRISPEDYFVNLSYEAPVLKFPEAGISKNVVGMCELISTLLLEDVNESESISKVIVMIFEYYFVVSPVIFLHQGAIYVNDHNFMEHFLKYVRTLCAKRDNVYKELGNTLAYIKLSNHIKQIEV